ncbi:ATP-NAD kinase family protein [Alloalcanivorax gelatiniphagus]|uniref:ATP-NAD kinase n=2 Tax=Alloalcanivorax gelatiniphagus TaxID=1194167 RepID=A0ABY2XLK6_9GAMM|nr:ATP-NAD kinase family protein [Alloalcanivorax gelatiniphagus]TMW13083.1 ATP-NAD kinase [Alloalcanivorax gelatiniphagus]
MTNPREPLILGVLVNPFAGIGGAVGLKGSDGADTREEALRRGAEPMAVARMTRALKAVAGEADQLRVLTWAGDMGEHSCRAAGLTAEVLGDSPSPSNGEHSRQAARALLDAGAQLLLFAGGDGTARDLVDAVGERVPVLGVPAGCKMHSAVYAINPEAAGRLLADLVHGGLVALHQAEVRDIDEDAFRRGEVRARHYGELKVPAEGRYLQQVKCGGREVEDLVVTEIAASVIDHLEPDTWYLVGSGSTVATVMEQLGLPNTLLGVDIVRNEEVVAADVGAEQILDIIGNDPARALITVIGGQGHLFGRGNQQFSPAVIRRLGKANIQILASRTKLATLDGRPLVVDTGDPDLDRQLCGLWPITSGYEDTLLYRVATDASA